MKYKNIEIIKTDNAKYPYCFKQDGKYIHFSCLKECKAYITGSVEYLKLVLNIK
jgi:hypothetical protein